MVYLSTWSHRGANLLSVLMSEVYEVTGIHKSSTTAYHPQADGLVENCNGDSCYDCQACRQYGTNWDDHLPYLLAYRTTA